MNYFLKATAFLFFCCLGILTTAQTTIYSTDFGTAANVNPASWIFSGQSMNISTNNPSFGYTGASGGAYLGEGNSVPFINTSGISYSTTQPGVSTALIVINTTGYSAINISFGMRRATSYNSNAAHLLSWSINGNNYTNVNFTEAPDDTWGLVTGSGLTLPARAGNQQTLYIRFIFNRTGTTSNYKIDDFCVKGIQSCLPVSIVSQPVASQSLCAGMPGTTSFSVGVAGAAPFSYQWQENGVNLSNGGVYSGVQTSTLTLTNPDTNLNSKNYRCIVKNCQNSNTVTSNNAMLTLGSPAATIGITGSTSFCQGDSVILSAPHAATYLWSDGETTQSIKVTATGNFSFLVTDAHGCTAVSTIIPVNAWPLPAAFITPGGSTIICPGDSVLLSSSLASSYAWSNGASTRDIFVSSPGDYSVTITDLHGCTGLSQQVTVTINCQAVHDITASGSTVICEGDSVILTARLGISYLWSDGRTTRSISVTNAGTYWVSISDSAGSPSVSGTITVTVMPAPTALVTSSGNLVFCSGDSVLLNAFGEPGYSYQWSNGFTGQVMPVYSSGDYFVLITDANGCKKISTVFAVSVKPLPLTEISANGPVDFCPYDSVILSAPVVTGYAYEWSTGEVTNSIVVDTAGTYSVLIIGGNGCEAVSAGLVVTVHARVTDINFDGITDIDDFLLFVQQYNVPCSGCREDIDGNGMVNIDDFLVFLADFNQRCD